MKTDPNTQRIRSKEPSRGSCPGLHLPPRFLAHLRWPKLIFSFYSRQVLSRQVLTSTSMAARNPALGTDTLQNLGQTTNWCLVQFVHPQYLCFSGSSVPLKPPKKGIFKKTPHSPNRRTPPWCPFGFSLSQGGKDLSVFSQAEPRMSRLRSSTTGALP